jgi:hypothetical protein
VRDAISDLPHREPGNDALRRLVQLVPSGK